MTSITAPTVIGWSEKAAAEYRDFVAPFRKNVWNTIDEVFNGKFGWVFSLIGIVSISGGLWFSQESRVAGFVGVGAFFVLYAGYNLASRLKMKPAEWRRISLSEFLDIYAPSASAKRLIKEAVGAERGRNPNAEFEIERLAKPAATKWKQPIEAVILWSRTEPFDSPKDQAVLALKDGIPVDLGSIGSKTFAAH